MLRGGRCVGGCGGYGGGVEGVLRGREGLGGEYGRAVGQKGAVGVSMGVLWVREGLWR